MRHFWLFLCLIGCGSFASVIQAATPLRIITVNEPPANYMVDGVPQGYAVDIVRALQHRINNQTPIEVMPEDRALRTADQQANVLLFSFSRTPEREDKYIWLASIMRKSWQLFVLPDVGISLTDLTHVQALDGVAVVQGDIREKYLRAHLRNLVAVVSPQQMLDMLQTRRVQALVSSQAELDTLWQDHRFTGDKPIAAFEFGHSDVYLMFSLGTDRAIVEQWQRAMQQLTADGTIERIGQKWLKINPNSNHLIMLEDGRLQL